MLRTFSPHAAAYAARCTPDQIRDWRCRGFLTDYGERLGQGYLYNASDVAVIALAVLLARTGLSLSNAFEIVRECTRVIHGLAVGAAGMQKDEYVATISFDPDKPDNFSGVLVAPYARSALFPVNQARPIVLHIGLSTLVTSIVCRLQASVRGDTGRVA